MQFKQLNLIEPILKALEKEGYKTPTPIQQEAIPALLQNRDLLGCAQTGTGKTAAFALPIIQQLYNDRRPGPVRRTIQALILTPTRELAVQIDRSFATYGAFAGLKHTVILGGVAQNPQVQLLRAGIDILVATPGRLIDLLNQGLVSLKDVRFFVLDEADRMLDMGFLRDVERVIEEIPAQRQTMLFSATMPEEIEKLTKRILKDPVKVTVTPVSSTVDLIEQSVYYVNKSNKTKLLVHLLHDESIRSALVFSRTKHGANKIEKYLQQAGVTCDVIHSNKAQNARQLALSRFKSGQSRVLVATDIVARGIDIDELSHVFNFDLPEVPEDYVHRIGRTGRAGFGGTAIAFCDEPEMKLLKAVEKLISKTIPVVGGHPYPLVHMEHDPSEDNNRRPPYRKKPEGRSDSRSGGRSGNRSGGQSGGRSSDSSRRR